jgi:membrane-associated phospholipid phosphatase
MPLVLLFAVALSAGLAAALLAWRYPRAADPARSAARKVGEEAETHPGLRAALAPRLDPEVATGLALTLALLLAIAGGVLFGVLAYLVRTNAHLLGIDRSVARWGNAHASRFSTHVLNDVTQLGSIYVVVVLCVILATVETVVQRSAWVAGFILAVMAGEEVLVLTVKQLADRVRPAFDPVAATFGPSFPSGHSATAAAFYATAALLIGRRQPRPRRAALIGLAIGIAVGVAASRVLLDVHWLTDVIAGLALGWAWFAVCSIAFGGRILRFGAGAELAARAAARPSAGPDVDPGARGGRVTGSIVRK